MNLETVAISRQIVETQGLALITEAFNGKDSSRSILRTINLIWPQTNRLPPVRCLRRIQDHHYSFSLDRRDPVQMLMAEGFTVVSRDGVGHHGQETCTFVKLLYSTYPSGTQYLAGVGVARVVTGRSYLSGVEVNELSVDFYVHYFSEKASMNVPYKDLNSMHDLKAEKEFLDELIRSNKGDAINVEIGKNDYKLWREGVSR